ncbi:RloB family protein [Nonomuraea sp. NPDC059194]|uniref:RloB family protein n=1 Tax=Nonomuraea sp. NPDC059194 TaxID=3346764 RepID=UPI0036CF92BD
MSRREGSTRRQPQQKRRLTSRLLVVCGSLETEKQYLDGLKVAHRNPAISVAIKTKPKSPLEVVKYAHSLAAQNPDEFDEIDVVRLLRKHLPAYDKAVLRFADYASGVDQANHRAQRLGDDPAVNPSTGVWRLMNQIKGEPGSGPPRRSAARPGGG